MILKKIEQQNKTIEYIKKKYKQKTGEDVVMPFSWQDYLQMDEGETPSQPLPILEDTEIQVKNFRLAIDQLNLPSRINANKSPLTSFTPNNKFHMVEHINLSGFKDNGFSKQLLRQFISRIVEMRALNSVILKNNGIDDNCAEQIQSLFSLKRITKIDLSSNKLGKSCLQIISKNFGHIEWIDLSRNYFLFESYTIQSLLNSVRLNGKIWHICLDLQDQKHIHTLCSYLKIKPQIHSFGLIDSCIDLQSMGFICKVLQQSSVSGTKQIKQPPRIYSLNLQNCYPKQSVINSLIKSLAVNTTLISLNLNNNMLGEPIINSLIKILQSNISLISVYLANNLLEDSFGESLARCLEKNQIVQIVDIGRNNIGINGGECILQCLSAKNDTLESLGDFYTNQRMGQKILQKIRKALKINKVSKQLRAKIVAEENELSAVEISNRQTEAYLDAEYKDFDLLVPIAVSNPLHDNLDEVHLWNFNT